MGRATATDHTIQRTTLELDMTELEGAKKILGTVTIRETVNTALREVSRRAALARAAALVEEGAYEVVSPDELTALRRARIEE